MQLFKRVIDPQHHGNTMRKIAAHILCLLLAANSMNAIAQTTQPAFPNTLSANLGDLTVKINGPDLLWSPNGVDYRGTIVGVDGSVFITVATIKNVGHLGSAHFLDVPGKPGEVEKEPIDSLTFVLDGKPIENLKDVMEVSGKVFRVERKSRIRDLDVDSTFEWRDNKAIEFVRIHANKPVELSQLYPVSFPWTSTMREYVFGMEDGSEKSGVFLPDDKKPGEGLEKNARWFATFDPESHKGGVAFLAKKPANADTWFQYTDGPKIYRKLRMMSFVNQTMPAGFDGEWMLLVGFFESDAASWKSAAKKCLADLKSTAKEIKLP
jgi:hypothetical protein